MASIWLMVALIIFVVFIVMAISSKKQEIVVKFVFITFIFVMITVGYVYAKTTPDLTNASGVVNFTKSYFIWVSSAFSNAIDVSGYISKMDWSSENKSEIKKNS
ncbi:MAG: hypothetical protein AABY03_00095 [Nanoarchaeota archaeon]|mgnify:CR=1 FL=1